MVQPLAYLVKANICRSQDDIDGALAVYKDLLDALTRDADTAAREQMRQGGDQSAARHFSLVKAHLRQSNVAGIAYNNMAVLFMDLENYGAARSMLQNAVDVHPRGYEYAEAKTNLMRLDWYAPRRPGTPA